MKKKDMVNHPDHYTKGIETIEYINSWGMGYVVGNIIKYITRYPYKGTPLKDLEKARWYLDYLIKQEKNK
tara:strand:- start:2116 stop:2325 length:210 start_codon:yes stop_codon:yes gene_type:complete